MNNPNINPKTIVPPVRNLTNRSPLRRGFLLILLTLALALFAISQTSQAVTPLPDEGYPNGNTGEGHGGLFSLTTGSSNTAIGLGTLIDSTTSNRALWLRRYDGPTGDPDEAYAVAVNPDGSRVFVTGRSFGLLGEGRDYATVAYDAATGQELWVRRYVGPGHGEKHSNDEAYAVAVSP